MFGCSRAAAECHSDQSDVEQPKEVRRNGKEPRRWSSEAEWTTYIQQYCSDLVHPRSPSAVSISLAAVSRSPSAVSIFRVPNFLRTDTTDAYYAPTRVSLGPYHHGRQELLSMEDHKPRALCRMMTRFHNVRYLSIDPNNMKYYVLAWNEIMQLEESIRNNYEEKIDHEKEFLAAMLTLDGSFILEILRTLAHDESGVSNHYEPIFEKNKIIYTGDDIVRDILKLENQIPLIVLQKLLYLESNSAEYVQTQLMLAVKGLLRSSLYPFNFEKDINQACFMFCVSLIQHKEVHHLLGLLHALVLSPGEGQGNGTSSVACSDQGEEDAVHGQDGDNYTMLSGAKGEGSKLRNCTVHHDEEMLAPWLPRAVELRNAGIKFERCNGGIKKIKFDQKSATLFLPPINITIFTEVLFRNLIAFEMCSPSEFNYVMWYVSIMNDLVKSEEDVALLRKMGIVTAGLGTDANVADLFNGLIVGITVDRDDPENLAQKVFAHYNNKFNVQCAQFVKEYFSSSWKTVALAGSIFLLLLTTVQTIFAILAVYK